MSMPNPQHDQIVRILSKSPICAFPLSMYNVYKRTRYFVHDPALDQHKEIDCLGVYGNEQAVLFGEWQGIEEERPRVSMGRIEACFHAFLVRSATDEEIEEQGSRKVLILLEIENTVCDANEDAKKIVFRLTKNIGYYNPIV